jgi:hypothetical protein
MAYGFTIRDKTIIEQVNAIKLKCRNFTVTYGPSFLKTKGELQPTSRSDRYTVEIRYKLKELPKISVTKPKLIPNFNGDKIPHTYPGVHLCLYRPKYREFTFIDLISDTIIPWTSLWLYHYEVWHLTGEWKGGGEHPKSK